MTLRITLMASIFAIGCGKGEDSGDDATLSACDALVAEYCACDCIEEAACTSYEEAMAASTGDEATCESNKTAWDLVNGCDSICVSEE